MTTDALYDCTTSAEAVAVEAQRALTQLALGRLDHLIPPDIRWQAIAILEGSEPLRALRALNVINARQDGAGVTRH